MDPSTLLWWHLHVLNKTRYEAIMQIFGNLEEAAKHLNEEFLRGLGCREETAQRALLAMEEFDADKLREDLIKRDILLLTLDHQTYPKRLKHTSDAPPFLAYRGDISVLHNPCIGIVGTRRMSPYGKRTAQEFVPALVQAGVVTVSGLAQGIDSEVALETIGAGGKTVAVLGQGLGTIQPKSKLLMAERIAAEGGLVISEFPLYKEAEKFTFPARNRIIAGLSIATLVLEAPEDSGALITAEMALEEGREVFAVPGQIFDENYKGCNKLIATGQAQLVTSPADVLRGVGIVTPEGPPTSDYEPQNDDERKVLAALTSMPQLVDDVMVKTGLSAATIGATLTMMELSGAARNMGGGLWVRR